MRKTAFLLLLAVLLSALPQTHVYAQDTGLSYLKRAEAVMLVLRNSRRPINAESNVQGFFPDVPTGEWYEPYMYEAVRLGMVVPEPKTNKLYPLRSVSRIDFLRMMAIAFPLEPNLPYKYIDIPQNPLYRTYVGVAYAYKLFYNEKDPGLLMPNLRMSHEEAAKTVYDVLSKLPELASGNSFFTYTSAVSSIKSATSYTVAPVEIPAPPLLIPTQVESIRAIEPVRQTPQYVPPVSVPTEAPKPPAAPSLIVSQSTPTLVKSALLKLVRNQGNAAATIKTEIVQLVNSERAAYKLPPLKENFYLENAAQAHAKDMDERGYFSHFTPEGKNYIDRVRLAGYLNVNPSACSCTQQFTLGLNTESILESGPNHLTLGTQTCSCKPVYALGENIARGQITAKEVMEDWMASTTHRENILRKTFDEIGIGLFGDVWVQEFGRLEFE